MGAVVFEGKTREDLVQLIQKSCVFPVKDTEIGKALEILLAENQLSFATGVSQFEGGSITTKWDFDKAEIKQHHQSNLKLAIESIPLPIDQRFLNSVTIPCNDELYQSIVTDVRSMCMSILERSDSLMVYEKDPSKVVTLQVAMFPYFGF